MGFPGDTVDLPTLDHDLADEARAALLDPERSRHRLVAAALGAGAASQLCCGAWVFDTDRTHLLLVQHRLLGWCNPGGHVHQGETASQAATRELAEETGLEAEPARPEPVVVFERVFPAGPQGGAHRHWLLGYAFVVDRSARLAPEPGAPLQWFALDVIPGDCAEIAVLAPTIAALLDPGS